MYFCFMYIPPSNSRLFVSGKSFNFDKLMSEVTDFESMGGQIISETHAIISKMKTI